MRLRTIGLISTLVLGLLAAPLHVEAQQPGKVYRIGYLRGSPRHVAYRHGLRELGYVAGQNYVIEHRSAEFKRLPEVAAEFGTAQV